MNRISQEKKMSMKELKKCGQAQRAITRALHVSEGSVRYHLRRNGLPDGRSGKAMKADAVASEVSAWMEARKESGMPVHLEELHEHLCLQRGYTGSYKSVCRYVIKHYPGPRRRPYRRVEMPAGAQAQVDWCEREVRFGGRPQKAFGLMMVPSHSRAEALVWMRGMDQEHWQQGHNECFQRLGGIPATVRIDNLKTGMDRPGVVSAVYERYAAAGFLVDGCPVRHPEAKSKVESRIGKASVELGLDGREFADWVQLQAYTDERLAERRRVRICPATGTPVEEAWQRELALLQPADAVPSPFAVVVTRRVANDN